MQKFHLLDLRAVTCFSTIVLSVKVVAMSIQALEHSRLPSLKKKPKCFAICALKIAVSIWVRRGALWVRINH